jgi:putative protein kinase ArgK-like GTPase of G3E family
MKNGNGFYLKISTVITLVALSATGITGYFNAISEAKEHAERKIEEVKKKVDQKVDKVEDKVDEIQKDLHNVQIDTAVVKQILIDRYGMPKDKDGG